MIVSTKSCYSVRAICIQDVPGAKVCQHVLGSVRDCQGNTREDKADGIGFGSFRVSQGHPRQP